MTERNWRDSIRALGSHIDLRQDEQVKKTKIGINSLKRPQALQYYWRSWDCPIENKYTWSEALRQEPRQCYLQHRLFWCALPERVNPVLIVPELELDDRVAKLMKLIQHKSRSKKGGGPIFDLELIELIDDFHKKYQTLYSLYENLKGHVLENVYEKEDKDNSSSSSVSFRSSSELEPCNSIQQFEELKSECARLSERLVEKEREIEDLSMEVKDLGQQNDGLRGLIQELEMTVKQREEKLSDLLIKLEENEADLISKSEDLMEKASDLRLEVDALWSEKEIVSQEGKLVHDLSPSKSKSESSLLKVHEESSGFLFQLELLRAKFERKNMELQKIAEGKKGLEMKANNLENQMKSLIFENAKLGIENEDLHVSVSELKESLMERNHEVFILEVKFEALKNDSCTRIRALGEEIMSSGEELNEIEHFQEIIRGKEEVINRLNEEKIQTKSKYYESNLKKLKETSDNLQKNFEDNIGTTKVAKEKVTDVSLRTDEIMSSLNSVEMKLREYNRRFLTGMSMCSNKVILANDWAKTKYEVIHEMEGNLDFLCREVRRKEIEIMELKERIWKLENDMLSLGEEKREAIRQLCVWVEYHRSQNNNLKKILSNLHVPISLITNYHIAKPRKI